MMQEDDGGFLELLRTELDAAAFIRFDSNGLVIDRSERLLWLLGETAPAPDDMALLWARMRVLMSPDPGDLAQFLDESRDREFACVAEPGGRIRLSARLLRDGRGNVLLLQRLARQLSVDPLEQINVVLEHTLNQLPVGLAVVDGNRRILHASDAALAMVGRRREEVIGRSTRLLYPDDATFESVGQRLYPARSQRVRTKAQHRDGSLVEVEVTMLPLPDATGSPHAFVALIEDLTRQESLAAELDRFQDIVEASSDALVFVDRDYRYRAANRAYLSVWRKRRDEIIGHHVRDIVGAAMFDERIKSRLDACLQGEQDLLCFEDCVSSVPIEPQYIEVRYTAHRKADGSIDGVVVNIRNTTERVRSEQALKQQTDYHLELLKKQAILLENLPALVFIKDLENNILQVTQRVADLTGLPRDRIEGRPSAEIYPEMADRYYADDRSVIESGEPKRGIVEPMPGPDGEDIWLLTDKIPYRDESGEIAGIIVCALDITALRQSQLALEDREKRYRTLIELIPQGVVVHDQSGHITAANPAACQILGRSLDDMLGLTSRATEWRVIREDCSPFPGEEHPAMQTLRTGDAVSGVVMGVFNPKLQDYVWIQVDAVPLTDADGETVGVFASFADITEDRQLQQAMIQSQKLEAIGQLAGGIAHDFNNILGSMLGFAELAQLRIADDNPKVTAYLEQIQTAGLRARDLVRQLMIYSRGDRGDAREPLPVAQLLGDCIVLMKALLPVKVVIEFDEPADGLMLLIDPVHMHQIMINLGVNAGDAMPAGGRLKITAGLVDVKHALCRLTQQRVSGRWLEIGIADNGWGMSNDLLNDIFQPFFTTKEVGKGSGMGLAVVAGLVGGYGGHILVSSEMGQGTQFRLLFPPVDHVD